MNLPILDQLRDSRSILIAGMGGGFDVYCGLPIALALRRHGLTVHLASYSFSDVLGFEGGMRLSPTLVGMTGEAHLPVIYGPELYLARWLRENLDDTAPVWAFHKTGVRPLAENYRLLVERLSIDALILVDGGVDSLACGDEADPGTFIEDTISLVAACQVTGPTKRIVACVGFGAEPEVGHAHALENMAALASRDAFLGACALTRQMDVYQHYEAAVLYAQSQPYQDPSVINSSVVSAVRGHFGNYHLTERTRGSPLFISPLMSLCWFFDADTVLSRNLIAPVLTGTDTFQEATRAALIMRRQQNIRRQRTIPL
jgi:hypothetical protein